MSEDRSIPYSEKLKDPRWQKKRLEILERDGWHCKNCLNEEKTLNVHHIFYLSNLEPWEIPDGFLLTLCEDCHNKEFKRSRSDMMDGFECSIIFDIAAVLQEFWKSGRNCGDILSLAREIYDGR